VNQRDELTITMQAQNGEITLAITDIFSDDSNLRRRQRPGF
jgi:hypothetical protein